MCRTFFASVLILIQVYRVYCSIPHGFSLGRCGRVHITVSSLQDTHIELNWINANCSGYYDAVPDFIILSTKDLRGRDEDISSSILLKIRATDYPDGYFKTKYKFRDPWLPGNWEYNENIVKADAGPHCLPFWISSIKYEGIVDSRCLAIQPTWMYDNRHDLGNQKIGNIFIPGTHNSGSYDGVPSFLEGYILNQDRSVWTQLVFGIRYLDFRIGYYSHEGGFYVNHDQVRVTKIEPILKQIRKFVQLAPSEIIVVDFHRFPYPGNFTRSIHQKFTDLLNYYLGDAALHATGLQMGSGPTLNEIWAQNKSLIVCYADRSSINNYPWLWQSIKQFWGDNNKVSDLKYFLYRSISQHKSFINPLWALMAELTPQPWDIILRRNSLRVLAQNVNKEVTRWFRDEWFNEANIVATDYFLGNDLINVAIEGNKLKH